MALLLFLTVRKGAAACMNSCRKIIKVQKVYESRDIGSAWDIISKYDVKYEIPGDLEREKFVKLGEVVKAQY